MYMYIYVCVCSGWYISRTAIQTLYVSMCLWNGVRGSFSYLNVSMGMTFNPSFFSWSRMTFDSSLPCRMCLWENGRYSTGGTLPTVTEVRRPVVTAQGDGEEEDEEDEAVRHIYIDR